MSAITIFKSNADTDSNTENNMKSLYETIPADSCNLFEMANATAEDTGLPMNIWLAAKAPMQHNTPMLKFQNNYSKNIQNDNLVPISISEEPEILKFDKPVLIKAKDITILKSWIKKNLKTLLAHWNNEISSAKMFKTLEKV